MALKPPLRLRVVHLRLQLRQNMRREQAIIAALAVLNYTTIAQSPYPVHVASVRKPHGLLTISVRRLRRLHDDCTISVLSPHVLHTALPRSVAESSYQKSHVARIQCKHIRCSPPPHPPLPPPPPPPPPLRCLKNRTENRRQINLTASGANVI